MRTRRNRAISVIQEGALTVIKDCETLQFSNCPYLTLLCKTPFSSLFRTNGKRFEITIREELGFTFSGVGYRGVPSNIVAVGDIFHQIFLSFKSNFYLLQMIS